MTKELSRPIFLKDTDSAKEQLKKLKALEAENKLTPEGQKLLQDNIEKIEFGIKGEDNIAFQLKHSYMPMYVLQDVYLEDDETETHGQIDFLVFTRKLCFVIESKYVTGKVSIDCKARFTYSNKCTPKGCESPIAQNQRHIDVIRQIRRGNESFKETYCSVIVFSNYEMVLDDTEAPDEIGKIVIRADELIGHIKAQYEKSEDWELPDEQLKNWAKSLQHLCRSRKEDYFSKYQKYLLEIEPEEAVSETIAQDAPEIDSEDCELLQELDEYRKQKEQGYERENLGLRVFEKQYIPGLVKAKPKTKEELSKVKGFGSAFVKRFGDDIINIITNHYNQGDERGDNS